MKVGVAVVPVTTRLAELQPAPASTGRVAPGAAARIACRPPLFDGRVSVNVTPVCATGLKVVILTT